MSDNTNYFYMRYKRKWKLRYLFHSYCRKSLLYLILLLSTTCTFSQSTTEENRLIDSLQQVIETSRHDTITFGALYHWDNIVYKQEQELSITLMNRVIKRCREVLNQIGNSKETNDSYSFHLSKSYYDIGNTLDYHGQYEKAIIYFDSSLQVTPGLEAKGTAWTLHKKGISYMKGGLYQKAIETFQLLSKKCEEINEIGCTLEGLNYMGIAYSELGEYDKAIEAYEKGIKIGKEKNSPIDSYEAHYHNLGEIYEQKGNLAKAIEYYRLSWEVCEQVGYKEGEVTSLVTIGKVYLEQGDIKQAENFARKALEISEAINAKERLYRSWNLLGKIYRQKKEYQQALDYLNKGIFYIDNTEDALGKTISLLDIGLIYKDMNNLDSALVYFYQAHNINKKFGIKNELASSFMNIGEIYRLQGDYDKAQSYGNQSYTIAQEVGNKVVLSEAAQLLYKSYKAIGNHTLALEMHETFITARDSIQSESNQKEVIRQEYLRKASIDSIQYAQEQELVTTRLHAQEQKYYFVIGGLILSALLSGFLIYFYLQMRKTNQKNKLQAEELQQLDKVKSNFFANISHELRTPLTLILGPLSYILDNSDEWEKENIQRQLLVMQRNGKSLMELIEEVLDLSKLEANKLELQEEATPVVQFFEYLFFKYEPQFRSEDFNYELNLDMRKDVHIQLDRKKLEKVLNNFLSNAIKFTPKGGTITLNVKETTSQLKIQVSDTGKGIHPKDLPHIFERFYQSKQADQKLYGGTGIGLALVNEFAQLMNGKAYAESTFGKGSTFFFEIPKKEVLRDLVLTNTATELPEEEEIYAIGSDFTIMVVEDNKDMRTFIHQLLQKKYKKVLLAQNGAEGLALLKEHGTDIHLIVSDVMMPKVDGLTMLKEIKQISAWSGIPVVMLTALAAERDKLTALTIGVDDYLTKPFSVPELLVRVQNLLFNYHQRQTWQSSAEYQEQQEKTPKNTPQTKINFKDKVLLEELTTFVEKSLEENKLSVETLAAAVFLSPRQLNRKLKAITGLSPAKFIKEVRLQTARKILENGNAISITEVAFSVGFENHSTFSNVFKNRFGKPPSEYLKNNGNNF